MTAAAHYVYFHRRASDAVVFYVGKGKGRRAWSVRGRNRHWRHVVSKHGHTVEVVRSGLSEPCALTLERVAIALIGRDNLANVTDGGGGTCGWHHSEETKRRIGAYHKGRPKPRDAVEKTAAAQRGRKLCPAHIEKLSISKRGVPRGPMPEAIRRKISASHVGLTHSEDARAKMSASSPRLSGKASPTYDHTIRTFHHPVHGAFVGTRGDLMIAFNLRAPCVSALLSGKQQTVKDWSLAK